MYYIYFTDTKTTENSQFDSVDQQVTIKRKLTKRHRNIQEQHKKNSKKINKNKNNHTDKNKTPRRTVFHR